MIGAYIGDAEREDGDKLLAASPSIAMATSTAKTSHR